MVKIEPLSPENFNKSSLDSFDRRHNVRRVYRRINGGYRLIDKPYTEDWDQDEKRRTAEALMSDNLITWLALDGGRVIGFIGLLKELNGDRMILDLMYVSADHRGRGIGRMLFEKAIDEARRSGARELYISACSSEETIAFYRAMGAELTADPIREMADKEPCDLQMTRPV